MKTGAMSKLSAALIVLVMALSAMVALPMASVDAADVTNDIRLLVVNEDSYAIVPTATVNLINLYTGEVVSAPYKDGRYVASEPSPGVYRVEAIDANYYDSVLLDEIIAFDGLSPYTGYVVELAPLDAKVHTWNITVETALGVPISGAEVGFYDDDVAARESVAKAVTNSDGWALVDMFDVPALADIWMYAMADGYQVYAEEVTVTSDDSATIPMALTKNVLGDVMDLDGNPALDAVAYLVDQDSAKPWIQRVLKSEPAEGGYSVGAHYGTFTVCVDAYGLSSQFFEITLANGVKEYDYRSLNLENQTKRVETVSMTFGADYNSFDMVSETVWSYDDTVPGLPYSDVGSLRMQIDLINDADGEVTIGEEGLFDGWLEAYGPEYVSTKRLLTVNDTVYSCVSSSLPTVGPVATLDITVETGVAFSYTASYESEEDIDISAPAYYADAYVKYDTPAVDYKFLVWMPYELPDNRYELVVNSTGSEDSFVDSFGFVNFTLDPLDPEGEKVGPEHVTLTFEKSSGPSVGARVVAKDDDNKDIAHVFEVTNETGTVLSYIVAVDKEVNFSADASEDPNGNPMTYTWDFGDGTLAVTTPNETIAYTYLSASANRTVTLTVTDGGDLVNSTSIYVMCDDQDPVPVISIKDLEVNETSGMLEVNQGQLVWFNATDSSDDAVSVGDGNGTVEFFEFTYGEGNTSGRVYLTEDEKNVSFSWADAGEYNLTLNVTDSVGHWKNTTLKVLVNDTQKPIPTFIVKNETWGTSLIENKTIVFDANATTDNLDEKEDMYFTWYFNDDLGADSWLNGTGLWNVTHVFEKSGSFAVRVNVTDTEGNWEGYTKTVTIVSGPRPNLVVDSITFDPEAFTEGETGYIIVNITNRGSAVATGIVLEFAIQNADGTEESIGVWTVILNMTTDAQTGELAVGGKAYVMFPYKFADPGTFTIKVNVTSADQLSVDEDVSDVTVDEAGWKKIALWGGVLGVIILVPALLYMRGRLSKREKKGPRREKAEKAEKAERAERRSERAEKPEKPGKGDEDL